MAPGPLPKPAGQKRRRNAATIPSTRLPAAGRKGRAPAVPSWLKLGKAGAAWWRWAWSTPQAAAWDPGSHVLVARRAALEDDLVTIESLDFGELLDALPGEFRVLVARLASLATGRLAIVKEMRELEQLLGLSPKALASLRWEIVDDEEPKQEPTATQGATIRRLKAVDPVAVAGS